MRSGPVLRTFALAAALAVAVGASVATAGDDQAPPPSGDGAEGGLPGFRSPSNNIHCMYDDGAVSDHAYPAYIRCDIQKIEGPSPPAPKDCDGEWGRSFSISKDADTGELICIGDTVYDETHPVLAYGTTWQKDGFTCASDESGITCFNALRHGFTVSRANRRLF